MSISLRPAMTTGPQPVNDAVSPVTIPQYRLSRILAIWAAAALPMAALAWLVAPAVAARLSGEGTVPMAKALIVSLGVGLVWQFVLVVALVRREQRSLHWSTVRDALWLRAPRSPRSGRAGGRVWLIVIPLTVAFAAEGLLPNLLPIPASHNLELFLSSDAGRAFFDWYSLLIVLLVFNTVLGEELLFRGFLLPRMHGAFGRADWLANGILFAAYHLHMPWSMLAPLADALVLAYPTKRLRSAWIGIAVHSAQSIVIAAVALTLVV